MGNSFFTQKVFENLPPRLKILTDPYENVEKDIILLSSIGVLSNCFPNVYGIYDGTKMYPQLYVLIVAHPASGKGVMNHTRKLIKPIHELLLKISKIEIEEWKRNKEENKGPCPSPQVVIMPGNISSAMIYKHMETNRHGVIIIESEADTLSNVLKNDWAGFSDLMRKAFHHETFSSSRKKDYEHIEINESKLAIVLSGTPDQVKNLLISEKNGLYSRFIIYSTELISPFKNVFNDTIHKGVKMFEEAGNKLLNYYISLGSLKEPIEFKYTKKQEERFVKFFGDAQNKIVNDCRSDFIPILRRHALIMYRITMILTMLRHLDEIGKVNELICSDIDFNNAMKMVILLIKNSLKNPVMVEEEFNYANDKEFFESMNKTFTRKELLIKGAQFGIKERTVDYKIRKWIQGKIIKKINSNTFEKNDNHKK